MSNASDPCGLLAYLREGCLNHLSNLQGFDALRNAVLEQGRVVNHIVVPQGAANLFGKAHGGFLMTLVDMTACMAGYTMGKYNVTQHVSVEFAHGACLSDRLLVEACVLHDGRSTALVETRVLDSSGILCVHAMVTLFYVGTIDPDDPPPEPFLGRNEFVF